MLTRNEVEKDPFVVARSVNIGNLKAYALFDSGSTHSFVSSHCVSKLMVTPSSLGLDLFVATPSDVNTCANFMLKSCEVSFGDNTICVDLIVLNMFDFDVIIDVNCLFKY